MWWSSGLLLSSRFMDVTRSFLFTGNYDIFVAVLLHFVTDWSSRRGDTTSNACRSNRLAIKLDMQMMIMKHSKYVIDGASGEYAKKPFSSKYFKDRIKLVLASKAYMNSLILSCRHIDNAGILDIKIPFLQIMGFEAQLSILSMQDKELYVVEDLQKFYFPITKKHIRQGGINDLVKAFSLLKVINEVFLSENFLD